MNVFSLGENDVISSSIMGIGPLLNKNSRKSAKNVKYTLLSIAWMYFALFPIIIIPSIDTLSKIS